MLFSLPLSWESLLGVTERFFLAGWSYRAGGQAFHGILLILNDDLWPSVPLLGNPFMGSQNFLWPFFLFSLLVFSRNHLESTDNLYSPLISLDTTSMRALVQTCAPHTSFPLSSALDESALKGWEGCHRRFLFIGSLFQISRAWPFSAIANFVKNNHNTDTSEDQHIWVQNQFNHLDWIAEIYI